MKTRLPGSPTKKGQTALLPEKEMPAYLATLSPNDWKPLFSLIPSIQGKEGLGKWRSPRKENGAIILPHICFGKTELKFLKLVYRMQLIVGFNWSRWEQGRKLVKRDVSDLDILTLLKLMTAIVRSDRYCEGALHAAIEGGVMLRILMAIRLRVEESTVQ